MAKRHLRSGGNPHMKQDHYCPVCDSLSTGYLCERGHRAFRVGSGWDVRDSMPSRKHKKRWLAWRKKKMAQLRRLVVKHDARLTPKKPRKQGGRLLPGFFGMFGE